MKGDVGVHMENCGCAECLVRRDRLETIRNRVEVEALGRLANTGWTDAAREVSLRVRRDKARIRELLKDRPDGTSYRDAGGTWIKRGGDVELVRVDGVYAAGQNNGRFITELAAGRRGDFFDPYSKGTINAMEHYGYLTPAQGAAARAFYGYGDTANRSPCPFGGTLANVGWTDEARAAALIARRNKASERAESAGSVFGKGSGSGAGASAGSSSASIRAPSPPSEGTIVNVGGWISIMMNGKLVRIGSTKVLCVLPDGQLGVKLGGKAYPIGKPSKWRTGMGGPRFVMMGGKYYLDVGKGYLDLATGQVRVKPGQMVPKGGGTVKIEIDRYNPFSGPGVEIPPDPSDISQRRYLQA